jgi:hypothetical protein
VGCGGAARALDRGWEAAEAAVDDEQELRRSSGWAARSGRRRAVQMWVRERKKECTGSSRMCFKSRRGHSEGELLLTSRRRAWQLKTTAARCGEAGRGPARGGKRRAGCRSGTWREGRRHGGSWGSGTVGEGGNIMSASRAEEGELEVEDRD